ncbi:hypothetical protein E3D00_02445 [Swingsia samuiensis]|uniref:Uncharacterized protein n=2 Tax=Swingsia samuiensis TaxID=1293412 RepID=A0A4Y6UME4_9PROT|nr:hypothetical protein E3D00_02445 [Swingsia samuiensis]
MKVTRSKNKQQVTLSFLEGSGVAGSIDLDEKQLTQLITSLGEARSALLENQSIPTLENAQISPIRKTNWALQFDTLSEGSLIAFQHPAYGPVGVVIDATDTEKLIEGLQKHRMIIRSTPKDSSLPS